jgi:hypothetical protein
MFAAVLFSGVLRWLIFGAVISAALGGAYVYVKRIGYAECKAEVDASIVKETKDGEKARTDAERAVARDTPDSVRSDKRNRDNWKQ